MSDDNAKLDRAEALAVIIAQAVRAMRDLGADNQQIITALQIVVDGNCEIRRTQMKMDQSKVSKSGQELITGRKKDDSTQAT